MTSKPAEVFGFKHRGMLKTGYFADIVVFNPDTIIDKGTFVDPIQFPEGIEYIFVNGQAVIRKGSHVPVLAGKVLRKSKK